MMPRGIYPTPVAAKISGSLWSRSVLLGSAERPWKSAMKIFFEVF